MTANVDSGIDIDLLDFKYDLSIMRTIRTVLHAKFIWERLKFSMIVVQVSYKEQEQEQE